ncbi:MAG: serine/threonine-protein kinase [Myxococcales bacterium]
MVTSDLAEAEQRVDDGLSIATGTLIGNYVIEGNLGRGGEGTVLLGRDSLLGRYVALKTARSGRIGETRGVEEARIAAKLEHPHVVRVYHAGRHKGLWFIVYEYVGGGSVQTRVQRTGPLPLAEALELICQAASGLSYAHQERIIHRDIKPHNLLVTRYGQVKIADFGLALERPGDSVGLLPVVGTPAFLAPELWRDGPPSPASDVYSLGACLYFMLVGRVPFPLPDLQQLRGAHLELTPKLPPHLPRGVSELLLAMLAKDPGQRPNSGSELSRELAEVAQDPAREKGRGASSIRPDPRQVQPFVPNGLERALQASLDEGLEHETREALQRLFEARTPLIRVCARAPRHAELVLEAACRGTPDNCTVLARLTVQRGLGSTLAMLTQALGMTAEGSLEQVGKALMEIGVLESSGRLPLLWVSCPRGLDARQVLELRELAAGVAGLGISTVQVTTLDEEWGPPEDDGSHSLRMGEDGLAPGIFSVRLARWATAATADRYFFSPDAARLLQHVCAQGSMPWPELAQSSVLVAAAAQQRIVTTWSVRGAHAQAAALTHVQDVPSELRKRPTAWPPADLLCLLRRLREGAPYSERNAPHVDDNPR